MAAYGVSQNVESRLLAWGGYLNATDQKSNKSNRWLMCVNVTKQEIHIAQHEQDHAVYPFKSVMCVFSNMKHPNALMMFLNNGKQPLHFFLDSQQDRDALAQLLAAIPTGKFQNVAIGVGASTDESLKVAKKGKLKWASRWMCICKNRILIYREKSSEYPLNMISLLEPNIHIQLSDQFDRAIQIDSQERNFHFQCRDDPAARNLVDSLKRRREQMIGEAKHYQKLKIMGEQQSKMDMRRKGLNARQEMVSKRELKSTRQLGANGAGGPSKSSIMLPSGSKLHFDNPGKGSSRNMVAPGGASMLSFEKGTKKRRGLKFDKTFKPGKHTSSIFLWGKARPPRLFPQHADQTTPFRHEQLSSKRFVHVTAAKDGHHAFGFTDNDWTFVWGEASVSASLGLGRDTRSTLPYLLQPLRRQKIVEVVCSSRHGLALTAECIVYGWGSKNLTNLPADVSAPKKLPFLNNLGVTGVSCSSTHSSAWHSAGVDVFTWGMPGPWLGFEDASQTKIFGRIDFDPSITSNPKLAVSKVQIGPQYTMIAFSDGTLACCGVNEHGRMGIGRDITETTKPMFIYDIPPIAELSAGSFHSGLLSRDGAVFTCGVGVDHRLGHGDEETQWIPKQVESLKETKICRIQCIHDRTFVITHAGCVLMWGVEPVSEMVHTGPFVFEYMRPYRIYQICGGKDFTIALGTHAKEPVDKPEIDGFDDPRQKKTHKTFVNEIGSVMGMAASVGGDGWGVKQVLGNYVQVEKQVKDDRPPQGWQQMGNGSGRPPQQGGAGMPPVRGMMPAHMGSNGFEQRAPQQSSRLVGGGGGPPPPGPPGPPGGGAFVPPPPSSQSSFGGSQPPSRAFGASRPPPNPSQRGFAGKKGAAKGPPRFGQHYGDTGSVAGGPPPNPSQRGFKGARKEDSDSDDEYYRKKQQQFGSGPPPPMMQARPLAGGGPPPGGFVPPPPGPGGFRPPPPQFAQAQPMQAGGMGGPPPPQFMQAQRFQPGPPPPQFSGGGGAGGPPPQFQYGGQRPPPQWR